MNLSSFAWIKTVSLSGGLLNFTLSMISLCFSKRSLLEDKKCAKWALALAKDSKLLGLVPEPNVASNTTYKILSIINEKAEAISGWYFKYLKVPFTSSSNAYISLFGYVILWFHTST